LSELKQEERQRQERANFTSAFNRRVWQPSEQPRAASRIVAVSVAVTLVAGVALGIGVMRSYSGKQAAEERGKAAALTRGERPSSSSTPLAHAPLPHTSLPPSAGGSADPARPTDQRAPGANSVDAPAPNSGLSAGQRSGPGTSPGSGARIKADQRSGTRNAYASIQAESYGQQSGLIREATSDSGGGQNIGAVGNGDWALYRGVNFGSAAATQFYARAASGAADGVSGLVEVRLDSRSKAPIGSFAVADTGGWQSWRTIPANITGVTGVHNVYLTFTSGQPASFVNVNWFDFGH
jgi:hypothetical protein